MRWRRAWSVPKKQSQWCFLWSKYGFGWKGIFWSFEWNINSNLVMISFFYFTFSFYFSLYLTV
jgi:hypothetical protein